MLSIGFHLAQAHGLPAARGGPRSINLRGSHQTGEIPRVVGNRRAWNGLAERSCVEDRRWPRSRRFRALARRAQLLVADSTRILMSTPGGKLRPLFRASMVLPVGCMMSIKRLWVRI